MLTLGLALVWYHQWPNHRQNSEIKLISFRDYLCSSHFELQLGKMETDTEPHLTKANPKLSISMVLVLACFPKTTVKGLVFNVKLPQICY